jgi:predicted neuraminidase
MNSAIPPFTPEENARLTVIWDRLYALYLEQVNGDRPGNVIEAEIQMLIKERDAIRPWGWNTGRNWKDDLPKEIAEKLLKE